MFRLLPAIHQFETGLGERLCSLIKENRRAAKPLFVPMTHALDWLQIKGLYTIQWSEAASNRRQAEEDTVYSFEVFLQNCGCKIALSMLMQAVCMVQCITQEKCADVTRYYELLWCHREPIV